MTTVSTQGLDPLHDPTRDTTPAPIPVDSARRLAREALADCASADVHSNGALMVAAITLECRLRSLLDALDAEEGRTP